MKISKIKNIKTSKKEESCLAIRVRGPKIYVGFVHCHPNFFDHSLHINRELVAIKYNRQKHSALLYSEVDLSMLRGSLCLSL